MILEQVCNDVNCDESQCMLRHPNPCFWGIRCRFNKRGECLYSHVTFASCDDDTIKALKTDFNDQLGKMENQVKLLQIDSEKKRKNVLNHTMFVLIIKLVCPSIFFSYLDYILLVYLHY